MSPAFNALKRLGARDPILSSFRGSFAFVGYAETNKPPWVTQEQKKRYEGPSIISLIIPLQSRQTSKKYIIMYGYSSGDGVITDIITIISVIH